MGDGLTVLNSPCSHLPGVRGARALCWGGPCPTLGVPLPLPVAQPSPALLLPCPSRGGRRDVPWAGAHSRAPGSLSPRRQLVADASSQKICSSRLEELFTWCLQKLQVAVGTLGQITVFRSACLLPSWRPLIQALTSICLPCEICEVHSRNYKHVTLTDYTFHNYFELWHFWSRGNMQTSG